MRWAMPILMVVPTIPHTPCCFSVESGKVLHGVCGLFRECLS